MIPTEEMKLKECKNCKMAKDRCEELKYRIYQLSNEIANIRQDSEKKEKAWKTNKVIITIAVIITIINIAIHFLR
jgi:hypothetical protein